MLHIPSPLKRIFGITSPAAQSETVDLPHLTRDQIFAVLMSHTRIKTMHPASHAKFSDHLQADPALRTKGEIAPDDYGGAVYRAFAYLDREYKHTTEDSILTTNVVLAEFPSIFENLKDQNILELITDFKVTDIGPEFYLQRAEHAREQRQAQHDLH